MPLTYLDNFLKIYNFPSPLSLIPSKNERKRGQKGGGDKRKKSFSINSTALYLIGSPINFRKSGAYLEPREPSKSIFRKQKQEYK